jgi:hypothetical protein
MARIEVFMEDDKVFSEWGGSLNYISKDGSIKNIANELNKAERCGYRIENGIKVCDFCGTPEIYPTKYHCCDSWRC